MPQQSTIEKSVIRIACNTLALPDCTLTSHTRIETLGVDSLDRTEMALHIEEAFDIRFRDDEPQGWVRISDIADSVQLQLELSR